MYLTDGAYVGGGTGGGGVSPMCMQKFFFIFLINFIHKCNILWNFFFFLQNLQSCCALIPQATLNIYLYTKLIWENWIIIIIFYIII